MFAYRRLSLTLANPVKRKRYSIVVACLCLLLISAIVIAVLSSSPPKPAIEQLCTNMNNSKFARQCYDLHKGSVRSTYIFGSCVVVDKSKSGGHDDWSLKCDHFPNGHLAVAPVKSVVNSLRYFLQQQSTNFAWIGLRQYDKSVEPAGHWMWMLSGRNQLAEAIYWNPTEPNNWGYNQDEDCGLLGRHSDGLIDNPCTKDFKYLCQYENPDHSHCYEKHENLRFNASTLIKDEINEKVDMVGSTDCAKICDNLTFCFGFSIKRSTGHCSLHQDDMLWRGAQPILDDDYDLYLIEEK